MRFLPFLLFLSITCSAQPLVSSTALNLFKQSIQWTDSLTLDHPRYDFNTSDAYVSPLSGVEHTYFIQTINGIEIPQTQSSIHIKEEQIIQLNNRTQSFKQVPSTIPSISGHQALEFACKQLGYPNPQNPHLLQQSTGNQQKQIIRAPSISLCDIPLKLVFYLSDAQTLQLAWSLNIQEVSGENWWSLMLDARTGDLLYQNNWATHCHYSCSAPRSKQWTDAKPASSCKTESSNSAYRAFHYSITHPGKGARSLIYQPDSTLASPFGWHDTNGVVGPEFSITRGNNVHAYEDGTNPGYSPDGGTNLVFDFPLDLYLDPNSYEDAAVTNLFYTANIAHDVLFLHGFDEASGNFQEINYTGQGIGGDFVRARSQIHSWCNSTFVAPPDGMIGTFRNFVCNGKDGSYSNEMVFHEYAHGLTSRLTGGPSNANCLDNWEQMGEGWSDVFSLITAIQPGDQGTDVRLFGDWFFNDPNGIRNFPYSTDPSINSLTYNDIKVYSGAHDLGEIWSSMLWDLTWALIDLYGWDPNLHTGTGGNNKVMLLIIEALKLQPCSPGFVDGRDAILAADQALFNGAHQCLIWSVFAKRGLGKCADQGDSNNTQDGFENYSVPFLCGGPFGCDTTFTRTEDLDHLVNMQVSPIPVSDLLTVLLGNEGQFESGELLVSSIVGQLVYRKEVHWQSQLEYTIDLSGCSSGLYLISYQNSRGTNWRRVVKL